MSVPPPQLPPVQGQRTNTLAIASLVSSFFISILGIILGHIALRQIKQTGEEGRGLALAGTIIGYVATGIWVFVIGTMLAIAAFTTGSLLFFSQLVDEFPDEGGSSYTYKDPDPDPYDDDWISNPWAGTPHEEFCERYILEFDNNYRDLADLMPDPALAEQFMELDRMMQDDSMLDSTERVDLIEKATESAIDLCYS